MPIPYNISDNDLNFFAKGRLHTVPSDHVNFATIRTRLLDGDEDRDELVRLADVRITLTEAAKGKLEIVGNTIMYAGQSLHGVWVDKIFAFMEKGENFQPVFNALENLMTNPTPEARQRLPIFVERNKMGFLPDGRIVALKVVRDTYKDVHSNTFDNSVGKVVEIPREICDADPNRTCSSGLHVGAMQYLPDFGLYNRDRRVMLVAFWPADAVAVPIDYDGSKLRVCRYEVIDEMDKDGIEEFIGRNDTVVRGYTVETPVTPAYEQADIGWMIEVKGDDIVPDGEYEVTDVYYSTDEDCLEVEVNGRFIRVRNDAVVRAWDPEDDMPAWEQADIGWKVEIKGDQLVPDGVYEVEDTDDYDYDEQRVTIRVGTRDVKVSNDAIVRAWDPDEDEMDTYDHLY